MANVKWGTPAALTTLLNAEFNGLAAGSGTILGPEFDNLAGLNLFGDFELTIVMGVAPVVNTSWDIYMIQAVDGTNYEDGSATLRPPNALVGSFIMSANTTQRLVIQGVVLPPTKFKMLAFNNTGQAAAGGGVSFLKVLPYFQSVL